MNPTPDYQWFLDIKNNEVNFEDFMTKLCAARTASYNQGYNVGFNAAMQTTDEEF